jgi:hypothetical protein
MWVFFQIILLLDFPLIGIEPSAILTFREYIRLADDTESAKKLAKMYLIEEF